MGRKSLGGLLLVADSGQKTLKRINTLIKDIQREPYSGLGKPEPLRENLGSWRSRRIDDKHRIVYKKIDKAIIIASCKGHYDF